LVALRHIEAFGEEIQKPTQLRRTKIGGRPAPNKNGSNLDPIDTLTPHVDVHFLFHRTQVLVHFRFLFSQHDRVMAKDAALFAEWECAYTSNLPSAGNE
jgi:hypothetical protein